MKPVTLQFFSLTVNILRWSVTRTFLDRYLFFPTEILSDCHKKRQDVNDGSLNIFSQQHILIEASYYSSDTSNS